MTKHIMLNGNILPSSTPCIFHDNRGLRYGDCFTVSLRGTSSKAFFEDEYFDFMIDILKEKNYQIPEIFVKSVFYNDLFLILQKNRIYKGFIAHITFFRNPPSEQKIIRNNSTSILIVPEVFENEFYIFNETGLSLDYFQNPQSDIFFDKKYFGIFNNEIYSHPKVIENKFDDLFILDKENNIIRTLNSSVFFVKDKIVYYPNKIPNDQEKVFALILIAIIELLGYKTEKKEIKINDLQKFDEIFTADLLNGVQYVSAFKNYRYFRRVSLKIANKLNSIIQKYIEQNS